MTAPQNPIVLTYDADFQAFERRKRMDSTGRVPLYTVGSEQDHNIFKGELAFQYATHNHTSRHLQTNFIGEKCFTGFNGLSVQEIYDNVVFAGVADTEYHREKNRGDTAVTIRKCGTHTIVNTGDDRITQGTSVVWDLPLVLDKDGAEEYKLPAVNVSGIPKSKFLASVFTVETDALETLFHHALEQLIRVKDGGDAEDTAFNICKNDPHWRHLVALLGHDDEENVLNLYIHEVYRRGSADGGGWEELRAIKGVANLHDRGVLGELQNSEQKLVKWLFEAIARVRKHTIGVALSSAPAGKPVSSVCCVLGVVHTACLCVQFDILLGYYNRLGFFWRIWFDIVENFQRELLGGMEVF